MTKDQEIEALRAFAAKMGPKTYIGAWLTEFIPAIERDIRSDFQPFAYSLADYHAEGERIRAVASRAAADITDGARRAAAAIEANAETARIRAVANLRQALRSPGESY